MERPTLPRLVTGSLVERLGVMPAVVVTGPRQAGKSTLAMDPTLGSRRYLSLDDVDVLGQVRRDPDVLLGAREALTFDEVQREPDFLLAIKSAIDRQRRKGRFLLTGSANLLLMQRVSESLAGRASYLTLWPLTRREKLGQARAGLWDEILGAPPAKWRDIVASFDDQPADWRTDARIGGFPTPAVHLNRDRERTIWFDGYVRTYLERDLQVLASISALPDFRRLMAAAAARVGQLLNQTELGRDIGLSQPTVHRWLNLLETSYMVVRLPAFAVNRTKRLIKSPKLYFGDCGVALHLLGGEPTGAHLENLLLQDLLAWRDARLERAEVCYWRTASGEEVDFVVETRAGLLPIEVKSSGRPRLADTAGLQSFRAEYGAKALPGLLVHTGTTLEWLTDDVLAVPWWRLV